MQIVVSDANIWIDLLEVGLADLFFCLPFEFHTSELVLGELNYLQRDLLDSYLSKGRLQIKPTDYDFIFACQAIRNTKQGLSLADASVYLYALELAGMVLTGDMVLRKYAQSQGIETHGILWVFDCWLENGILDPGQAATYLESMMEINSRLPLEACSKRLEAWRAQKD
jgi:predicted nucleic acid-binding protein